MRLVYTRFDRIDGGDPVAFDLTVQSDAVALDVREAFTYVIGP
jgi:hypothetical protein